MSVRSSIGNIRNLTSTRYNIAVPAGGKQSVAYTFTTSLHPQDLRMNIVASLADQEDIKYQVQVFNQTVAIVDPVASIFDPQM